MKLAQIFLSSFFVRNSFAETYLPKHICRKKHNHPNVELPTVNNSKVSMTDASGKFNNAFVSEIEVEMTRF